LRKSARRLVCRAAPHYAGRLLPVDKGQNANVAKLVDARDLKSLDFGHTGSIPVVRTTLILNDFVVPT
jgi:hypothetical protein